tara:strand:+ start:731 stop:892 length:162 start_codon:yes stop_codon:yes gene_type:complete
MTKALDNRVTKLETENSIQFRDIFNRLKRLEMCLLSGMGAVILLLCGVLFQIN